MKLIYFPNSGTTANQSHIADSLAAAVDPVTLRHCLQTDNGAIPREKFGEEIRWLISLEAPSHPEPSRSGGGCVQACGFDFISFFCFSSFCYN